jgi:DNA mismatch repair protein MutL
MQPTASPRPIHALADDLINQIAAGEVIERPMSIVKELIENSLDAGASAIKIELIGGGIERISISDDGHGISPLELALALRRHCTSKITHFDDLDRIVSLGFRGEALASIGAVAELTLCSRIESAEHAWSITTGPRRDIAQPIPAARARGTTVTVEDLFATIPARRQFLRRPQTELLHIQQMLRGIAFCVPGVALSLRYDDNRQWAAPAARDDRTNLQRWQAVFGAEFAREALYLDVTVNGIRLYGWVGPARFARNQADLQYLAVNGRLIRDRQLSHAIRLAYGDDLGAGQFPTYALHLEIAASEVDVNVHPSKAEVRFRQIREVHDVIHSTLRQTLAPTTILEASAAYAVRAPLRQGAFQIAERAMPAWRARPETSVPAIARTGLIDSRFFVQTDEAGLGLLDLQRFTERQFSAAQELPAIRTLVFPVRLPTAVLPWQTWCADLAKWGFEFNEVGLALWVLRGVPAWLPEFDAEAFVRLLASASEPSARTVAAALCATLTFPDTDQVRWFGEWVVRARTYGVEVSLVTVDAAILAQLWANATRQT